MERGTAQLLDIMNEVSARLDHAPVFTKSYPKREVLDELQAFLILDPLLADLNKQYLDAKASRMQAQKEYGARDGMSDMAAIVEDSAWCAMQTRYMELRVNRVLMAKSRAMMDESRREEEEQERIEKQRAALKMLEQMQTLARVREIQETRSKSHAGWWLFLMLLLNTDTLLFRNQNQSYRFNLLAA